MSDDDFGSAIHEARVDKGWTLQQLAQRADVTKSYVWEVEHGANPSLRTMRQLVHALGWRLDTFFGDWNIG